MPNKFFRSTIYLFLAGALALLLTLLLEQSAKAETIHPGEVSLGCFVEAFTDCDLAKAVMHVETRGLLKHRKVLDANGRYSRGVMQIQDATAKQMGFKGNYSKLSMDSLEGFRWGVKYLRWQMFRYDEYEEAVAAYNAGSVIKKNGRFINYAYVLQVYARYRWLKNKSLKTPAHYSLAYNFWDGSGNSTIAFRKDYLTLLASTEARLLVLR